MFGRLRSLLRRNLGKEGEDFAANYLRRLGFSIIDKNITYKFGELDIVAQKDETLYFFEVRTRKSPFMSPLETITDEKKERVTRAAECYIAKKRWAGPCEIGYIGIDLSGTQAKVECDFERG